MFELDDEPSYEWEVVRGLQYKGDVRGRVVALEVPNGNALGPARYRPTPCQPCEAGGRPGWYLDRRAGRPYLNSERPGRAELGSAKPRELLTLFAVGSKS